MTAGIDNLQGDQHKTRDTRNGGMPPALGGVIQTDGGAQLMLSPEQIQEAKAAVEAAKKEKEQLVQELVQLLIQKRENVVQARRDIDKRWVDDQRQWDGESRLLNTKEFPTVANDDNMKPPRPHLTRARCDLWESRMIDLIVPSDDPIWDLKPLAQEDVLPPDGMDPQAWQQAIDDLQEVAAQSAVKMKEVIQDQFAACNAPKALRKMCVDACRLGTGLVMGPMNGTHVRRRYNRNDPSNPVKVTIEESIIPELREGDPKYFFPDMTGSAEKAEFAFYLHMMSESDLWAFAEFPGVDKDAVKDVMEEEPDFGEFRETVDLWNKHSGLRENIENRHAVWRYTGIVDHKYLKALNLDEVDGMVSADIWFCNQHILKSKLTMLSAVKDFRIPYYVFSPFPIDDTMFGASIAYLCRDSQRMADAALLIALHNLSVSAGPQIVLRKGKMVPADGKWSIRGPKIWYINDDTLAPGDVFDSIQINNMAEQAFAALQEFVSIMDQELNTTQWASPDTSEPAQSGIGWAMMSNARTILQRRVAACADDNIFGQMIPRFVLWNLLYNEREDIKGDYDVQPLCQSVRLVKDIQNQQKLFVAENLAPSPIFGSCFQPYDMLQDILRGLDVNVDNWLKPKQQWQQEQQQQAQSPEAQLTQAKLETETARAQTERMKQTKLAAEAQQPPSAAADTSQSDAQLDLQKHAIDKQVELQAANSDLAGVQAKAQSDQTVAAMNLQAKREGIAADIHKAHVAAGTALAKTGIDAKVKIAVAKTRFPLGGGVPKKPQTPFKAPKTPAIRGKR